MTPEQRKLMNERSSEWHKTNRARLKEYGFVMKRTYVHKSEVDKYDELVDTLEHKPAQVSKKTPTVLSPIVLPGIG